MKQTVARRVTESAPKALCHAQDYAMGAQDLERTLTEKVKKLSDAEFEGLPRPIFRAEEWTLIAAVAVLGSLIGQLQVQLKSPARP